MMNQTVIGLKRPADARAAELRNGERWLQPAPGSAMLSEEAWVQIARSLKLSGRELQLLRGVFDDRTESAIAADLAISPHTVHTYFERLHRKLAAADRVQLVLRVMADFMALRDLAEA